MSSRQNTPGMLLFNFSTLMEFIHSLKIFSSLPFFALFIVFIACQGESDSQKPADKAIEITMNAEDFTGHKGIMLTEDLADEGTVVSLQGTGWLSYDVNIPQSGRYQIEFRAASQDTNDAFYWIEDYINNSDGRTYDITGQVICNAQSSGSVYNLFTIDGSPLDKGTHKMKFHYSGGNSNIDYIRVSLMKKHESSPHTLKQNMEGEEWIIKWSDEFDKPGYPDPDNWTYDVGDWGWGNNELQYYTEKRIENARVEGGHLIIEARKDSVGKWSSARLTTRGKVSFVRGKIEVRAKVPKEKGNWAAAWTLGDKYVDELSWPECGEIDIFESVGYEIDNDSGDGLAHASVHCGAYYFKLGNQPTGSLAVQKMGEIFHNYSVEWTDSYIRAYVDDQLYFEYTDATNLMTWPFNEPQNLILNLAMGGNWGAAQGLDDNVTSQKYIIDYIRVYEKQKSPK